jgi:CysZ protein
MSTLLNSIFKAFGSLIAPGMSGVFLRSVFTTIAALLAFFLIASSFFVWLGAQMESGLWVMIGGTFISGMLAWLLFPGVMPIIVNFFDDQIATLIEKQDYPHVVPKAPDFWPELWHDARFSLLAVSLNVLVFPLYLVPLINAFVFFMLNGYLLGREFFVMVAKRHMPVDEAVRLRKAHRMTVLFAGMALVFCAITPLLNFIAPFFGIALMTHLFHRLTKPAEVLPPYRN